MFRTPINWLMIALILTAFASGVLLAPYFGTHTDSDLASVESDSYVCPMHSHVHSDHPGSCPICSMDLIPYQQAQTDNSVHISPEVRHNFGIRTTIVEKGAMHRSIDAYGYIQNVNSATTQPIQSTFSGTITQVLKQTVGDTIQQGQILFSVRSKQWLTMQEKFLKAKASGNAKAIQQASQPLFKAGIRPKQLLQLNAASEATGEWNVIAPTSGILSKALPETGTTIEKNTIVTALSEPFAITAYAEIFEGQWRWLDAGQKATMRIRSAPGRVWHGEVTDIEDLVTSRSRTIKVRTGFNAQEGIVLRSGMHADITLEATPLTDVIRIPREALIRTQNHQRVIVVDENNHYRPQEVSVGLVSDQWAEILSGLQVGDTIIVSGQFLIDSESTLKSALDRLQTSNVD